MRRRSNRLVLAGMILLALADPGRVARCQAIGPGFELELADRRMWDEARHAFLTGRRILGGDGTLALELAELEQRAGNWEASAAEWARAVTRSPDVGPNAASQLADAPAPLHDRVVRVLTGPAVSMRARRIGAEVLLIADSQLDIAEERLSAAPATLTADDRASLRLALAKARVARGELDRAAAALDDDSSVAAIAQRGWIALYRGDLKSAMEAFRAA